MLGEGWKLVFEIYFYMIIILFIFRHIEDIWLSLVDFLLKNKLNLLLNSLFIKWVVFFIPDILQRDAFGI